jgi:hypothetical protein
MYQAGVGFRRELFTFSFDFYYEFNLDIILKKDNQSLWVKKEHTMWIITVVCINSFSNTVDGAIYQQWLS